MHETMVFVATNRVEDSYRAFTVRTKSDADKLRGLRSSHVLVVTAGRPENWSQELHDYLLKSILAPMEADGCSVDVAHGCR